MDPSVREYAVKAFADASRVWKNVTFRLVPLTRFGTSAIVQDLLGVSSAIASLPPQERRKAEAPTAMHDVMAWEGYVKMLGLPGIGTHDLTSESHDVAFVN